MVVFWADRSVDIGDHRELRIRNEIISATRALIYPLVISIRRMSSIESLTDNVRIRTHNFFLSELMQCTFWQKQRRVTWSRSARNEIVQSSGWR